VDPLPHLFGIKVTTDWYLEDSGNVCSSTKPKEMHVTDTGEELCFHDLSKSILECEAKFIPSRNKVPLDDRKHQTDINKKLHFPSSLG